jgi:uncharacterized protein (TIGR02266 family)
VNSERRTTPRHSITIPVEISLGTSFSLHACENLSSGGAYFRHAIAFRVGTLVDVKFTLPGEPHAIHCKGEVANVPTPDTVGMGVRFVGLSIEEQERIGRFAAQWGAAV